jgi:hypothetical protein
MPKGIGCFNLLIFNDFLEIEILIKGKIVTFFVSKNKCLLTYHQDDRPQAISI